MTISLCLLVWNELEGCKIDVPNLPNNVFDEVYAIDGGSTDGTVEYLKSQNINVYKQPKKGLNAGYKFAVEKSSCDAVVVFFPKGTISPDYLLEFRKYLENGNDLVIASRNINGAQNEEDSHLLKPRKWCVGALAYLTALLWKREGYLIKDILHGVKGFTVDSFNKMNISDEGLSIDLEMVVRSYKLKLKRTEFPVKESTRAHGSTKFKILPTGLKLLKFLIREIVKK